MREWSFAVYSPFRLGSRGDPAKIFPNPTAIDQSDRSNGVRRPELQTFLLGANEEKTEAKHDEEVAIGIKGVTGDRKRDGSIIGGSEFCGNATCTSRSGSRLALGPPTDRKAYLYWCSHLAKLWPGVTNQLKERFNFAFSCVFCEWYKGRTPSEWSVRRRIDFRCFFFFSAEVARRPSQKNFPTQRR